MNLENMSQLELDKLMKKIQKEKTKREEKYEREEFFKLCEKVFDGNTTDVEFAKFVKYVAREKKRHDYERTKALSEQEDRHYGCRRDNY